MSALGPLPTPAASAGGAGPTPAGARAAQAAFFRAALDATAAPQARPAASTGPTPDLAPGLTQDPAPIRHGRPGALLDIRV